MNEQSKKQIPDYLPSLTCSSLGHLVIGPPGDDPSPRRFPFCEICQRPVDSFEWETPHDTVSCYDGAIAVPTGEVRITVKCHGETWRWRGFYCPAG